MSIHIFLLLALAIGIFVRIKSKKLIVTELVVCGSFGLLLVDTAVGERPRDSVGEQLTERAQHAAGTSPGDAGSVCRGRFPSVVR